MCQRKVRSSWSMFLAIAIFVNVAAAPCLSAAKDTLVIGLRDETASLDPAKAYETTSYALLWQMYDNLVEPNKDDLTKIEPELAESWEISADGKTWIFHLKAGVQFANGNPLNADAVVFSLHRSLKLESASSWILSQLGLTEATITKVDDLTVQLILNKPYAPGVVLACLTPPIASILDPQEVMTHEENGDMGSAWLETHSAGSGRFVLSECKRELPSEYVLTANSKYWRQSPSIKKILVKGIQESETAFAMLEQGQLDIAYDLQQQQIDVLTKNTKFEVQEALSMSLYYVAMNQSYPPLAKQEVREAIRYALNYDNIIQSIWGGAALKVQTFIPKGLLGYNASVPYKHDVAVAKQLMQAGGYSEGFDVEFKFPNYSPWLEIAAIIKQNLADIKIRTTLKPLPLNQFFEECWSQKRDSQLHMILWAFDYPDPDSVAKPFAHSTSLDADAPIQALAWWVSYLTPETAQIVDQASVEMETKKREELYKTVAQKISEVGPYAIFAQPLHQYAIRRDVIEFIEPLSISWIPFPVVK